MVELASMFHDHLDGEERALEEFARTEPEEAEAIGSDHATLRAEMDRLVNLARLGVLRARAVYEFKAKFSVHEAREERVFYRGGRGASS